MCLRLLTNMIIIMFKMKFITFVVLLIVLTYTTASALRNRENFDALIPNNDVGNHEMLNEILTEYDIDPNELIASDYVDSTEPIEERIVQYNNLPIIQPLDSNRKDSREDTTRSSSSTQKISTTKKPTTTTTKKPTTTTTKKPTTIPTERSGRRGSSEEERTGSISSSLSPSLSTTSNIKEDDTTENTLFTLSTTTTPNPFPSSPSYNAECLLGKVSEILQWVDVNGVLQKNFIVNNENMQDLEFLDKSNASETELVDPVEVIIFNFVVAHF